MLTLKNRTVAPMAMSAIAVLSVGGYVAILLVSSTRLPYDYWGALVVAPALVLLSAPWLVRAVRSEPDAWIGRLIVVAFVCKLAGGLARWFVGFVVYGGVADAGVYDDRGGAIALAFRAGDFTVDLGRPVVGTGFIYLVTAVTYVVTGPTLLGGYLVYAWLGFWGLYLFFCAFRVAFPGGHHRRYAVLLFLLPSLVFWPSGIGKEAWLALCLGAATLGAARLVTGTSGALPPLVLGLAGSAMVRPHFTAMLFAATFAAYLFRRDRRPTALSPVTRLFAIGVMLVAGFFIASQAAGFFGVEDVSVESVNTVLDDTQRRAGGDEGVDSNFQARPVSSPLALPGAAVSVLFRPFPWEATNLQSLLTSAEGVLLLVFALLSVRRPIQAWKDKPQRPYLVLCLAFTAMFVFAFSTFGNFGLLARQRVLVYPFLLALLCCSHALSARQRTAETVRNPSSLKKRYELRPETPLR